MSNFIAGFYGVIGLTAVIIAFGFSQQLGQNLSLTALIFGLGMLFVAGLIFTA